MPKKRIPGYRLHKPIGQAIVVLRGKMFYLGQYKNKASREKYDRVIAEYLANDRKPIPGCPRDVLTTEEATVFF